MANKIHDRLLTAKEIICLIDECYNEDIDRCNNCPLAAECMARREGVTRYLKQTARSFFMKKFFRTCYVRKNTCNHFPVIVQYRCQIKKHFLGGTL